MLFKIASDQAIKTNWYVEWPSCSYQQERTRKFQVESRSPVRLLRALLCPVPLSVRRMQRLRFFCFSSQQLVAKSCCCGGCATVPPELGSSATYCSWGLEWQRQDDVIKRHLAASYLQDCAVWQWEVVGVLPQCCSPPASREVTNHTGINHEEHS